MTRPARTARATRTLALLVGLTACLALATGLLDAGLPPTVFALAAALLTLAKVRLVALDYLGLRGRASPILAALLGWAGTILLAAAAARALMS